MDKKINILDYLITREEYEQVFAEFTFEVSEIYSKNPISHGIQENVIITGGDEK